MFLFDKRTKKVIKIIWGIFAVLIIFSMIVAYSGFVSLVGTSATAPQELTPEELAQLNAQNVQVSDIVVSTSTTATSTGAVNIETSVPTIERQVQTEPVPELRFGL
jgi:hypothetical protein